MLFYIELSVFLMELYISLAVAGVIVLAITLFAIFYSIRKRIKCVNDVMKLFIDSCKEKKITDFKLEYVKKGIYDIYFEDAKNIYYIKIIHNSGNHEICINNAIKWQIRVLGDTKGKFNFVEGIEQLMRMDLKNKEKKEHKLFVIYPNTRALLKVINECEMVFVYPDTDVYGSNVITYKKLEENVGILDL